MGFIRHGGRSDAHASLAVISAVLLGITTVVRHHCDFLSAGDGKRRCQLDGPVNRMSRRNYLVGAFVALVVTFALVHFYGGSTTPAAQISGAPLNPGKNVSLQL